MKLTVPPDRKKKIKVRNRSVALCRVFNLEFNRIHLAKVILKFLVVYGQNIIDRITDEGSVPEMRIWSILLIKSDLKWCIHLSRSLYLYFNYLVSVTAGGPVSPRGHM